ncbi:MAG: GNAT family N-acetyltransferase [Actinomycetia bacterium]|nr:GNAT family N-acetyltransferase [Actinomycetes bacterium]
MTAPSIARARSSTRASASSGSEKPTPTSIRTIAPAWTPCSPAPGAACSSSDPCYSPARDPDASDRRPLYNADELAVLAEEFPQGTVIGFDGRDRGQPVAAGLGLRAHFDFDNPQHDLKTFLDAAPTDSGDDPTGPWYYGTDIIVSPSYRRRGIGRELYDLRKQICDELGLAGIVAGRVIPGFAEHKHMMSADDYIAEVRAGRLYDSTLTFQPENGFKALCALANYVTDPAKLGLGFQAQLDMTVSDDARKVAAEVGGHDDAVYVVMTEGR